MTKQTERDAAKDAAGPEKPADAGGDVVNAALAQDGGNSAEPEAASGGDHAGVGPAAGPGQSLTLEQIRASGLDPAVYGYAPDA